MRALRALRPTVRQRRASSSFPRLEVAPRADDGSRAARRLRAAGLIPGVVYGGEAARRDLEKLEPKRLYSLAKMVYNHGLCEIRRDKDALIEALVESNMPAARALPSTRRALPRPRLWRPPSPPLALQSFLLVVHHLKSLLLRK